MAAIRAILSQTSQHELAVESRFRLLQRLGDFPGESVQMPQYLMCPKRVDLPEVVNGFVYILVSLRENTFTTCYVGETENGLLEELGSINAGKKKNFSSRIDLRPWSMAAFVFNFKEREERISLKLELEAMQVYSFRIDTMVTELENLCKSGRFGCVAFSKCGELCKMN